jgi:protein TonB
VSVAEAFTQTFPAPEWWRRMDVSQRVLTLALALSTLAHAGLLAVKFAPPDAFHLHPIEDKLDVILVNARHTSKPVKAEALAQVSLNGGGDAAKGRAQSFLTASKVMQDGDQLQAAAARAQQLEAEQRRLLTSLQSDRAKLAVPAPKQNQPDVAPPTPELNGVDPKRQSALDIKRMEAELAKRIADENARPKRGYITPSTQEVIFAAYRNHWVESIEKIGSDPRNFPAKARGGTYSLLVTVSVLADGRVENIEIVRSSGIPEIDRAAERIVKRGEPYERFTPKMKAEYGVIDLTLTWTFSRNAALSVESQH